MAVSETHNVVLIKFAVRTLNTDALERNIAAINAAANSTKLSVRGWRISEHRNPLTGTAWQQDPIEPEDWADSGYDIGKAKFVYYLYYTVSYERRDDKKPDTNELASVITTLNKKASQPTSGLWTVREVDAQPFKPVDDAEEIGGEVGYADAILPEDTSEYFKHLFGLDPQIQRVLLAVQAGIDSEWRNRLHVVLIGQPGCGKSDIATTLKEIMGEDAVMSLDGTAITSAGIIEDLSERPLLPRIIVVEEAEKAAEDALRVFLGMMDSRGEINKLTARGRIRRDTRVLVICTVNNKDKFDKMLENALSSRCSNRIFFKRPSREVLSLILHREISAIGGDAAWITPVLDYCDKWGIVDPREVITLALTGKGLWLTGAYEKLLEATSEEITDEA